MTGNIVDLYSDKHGCIISIQIVGPDDLEIHNKLKAVIKEFAVKEGIELVFEEE